jgi:hypothetical protein
MARRYSKGIEAYLIEGAQALKSAFKADVRYRKVGVLKHRVRAVYAILIQHFAEACFHSAIENS